jgi:hypothetical protein
LDRENNRAEEPDSPGPIYKAIERAPWALGPALILLMLLSFPAEQAARQQAEADFAADAASENLDYCAKWGMPAGSAGHTGCVRDLVGIRGRAEQHVRDQAAVADF